jgi:hypothetical protein
MVGHAMKHVAAFTNSIPQSLVCNVWFDKTTKKRNEIDEPNSDNEEVDRRIPKNTAMGFQITSSSKTRKRKRDYTQEEEKLLRNIKISYNNTLYSKAELHRQTRKARNARMEAPSSGHTSPASSSTSEVLYYCKVCHVEFTGIYGRGNLGRHRRNKHGIEEKTYPCEDDNCLRVFKRQNARLKHYRKNHHHLVSGPALPR